MKKSLVLTLSIIMIASSAVTAFGADPSLVPYLPGEINGKALALDLYNFDDNADAIDGQNNQSPVIVPDNATIETKTDNPIEALVQNYVKTEGEFTLTENSRIYIDSLMKPSADLYQTAETMSNGLKIVHGPRIFARKGDIIISCKAKSQSFEEFANPEESYELYVGDRISLYACHPDGIFYGLVTLKEMMVDGTTIPCCNIKDGPDLKERTIFLDCARKYFDPEWIKELIHRSAMQRYNALELHFSEAEGTRVESEVFPWLTAGNKFLTREEVKEIVAEAHKYHMDVIPSMDLPGHTQYIVQRYAKYVKKHPDWSFDYNGITYDKSVAGFGSIANHYTFNGETKDADYIGIDVTQPHAVAFIDALVDDYATFFKELGSDRFNISGDELLGWYNFTLGGRAFNYENRWESLEHWDNYARTNLGVKKGSASDTFIDYLNTLGGRLEEMGYRVRVFNDEINLNKNQHIKLKPSIELNYWTGLPGSPKSYAKDGHYMYNDVSHWNFYVVKLMRGADIMTNDFASVNPKNIYKNWNPRSLSSKKNKVKTIPEEQFGGSYFHIWCDHPDYKDAASIWSETHDLTWCNGTKMWNPEITDSLKYDNFKKFIAKM